MSIWRHRQVTERELMYYTTSIVPLRYHIIISDLQVSVSYNRYRITYLKMSNDSLSSVTGRWNVEIWNLYQLSVTLATVVESSLCRRLT